MPPSVKYFLTEIGRLLIEAEIEYQKRFATEGIQDPETQNSVVTINTDVKNPIDGEDSAIHKPYSFPERVIVRSSNE